MQIPGLFLLFSLIVAASGAAFGAAGEKETGFFQGRQGSFAAELSWTVNEFQLDVLRGRIEFQPGEGVRCDSIRGIQIARVEQSLGHDYQWDGNNAPRNSMRTKGRGKSKPGYFLDHDPTPCLSGQECSPYFRDSWPNEDESADGFRKADGSASPASLIDYPYGWTLFEQISLESCMVCQGTGEVYGCVDWGAIWPSTGARRLRRPQFHENPSATFWRALRDFKKYYDASAGTTGVPAQP